jgi:ABC-2 type transport system ATP-binding protein
MLTGSLRPVAGAERGLNVIKATYTSSQCRLIVRLDGPVHDPSWDVSEVSLEDIVLAYMGQDLSETGGSLTRIGVTS